MDRAKCTLGLSEVVRAKKGVHLRADPGAVRAPELPDSDFTSDRPDRVRVADSWLNFSHNALSEDVDDDATCTRSAQIRTLGIR